MGQYFNIVGGRVMHLRGIILILLIYSGILFAEPSLTQRIPLLSNEKVTVWKTIVYPNKNQTLKMHRHEHDRVVVALTDGTFKITNDKGKTHYLKLEKDKAYFLTKDIPGEFHQDENMTNHPIRVIVVELSSA
jgi:beta-alanine degradation protein BauB